MAYFWGWNSSGSAIFGGETKEVVQTAGRLVISGVKEMKYEVTVTKLDHETITVVETATCEASMATAFADAENTENDYITAGTQSWIPSEAESSATNVGKRSQTEKNIDESNAENIGATSVVTEL